MLVRIRGNDPITLLVEFSFVDVPNRRNYLGAFFLCGIAVDRTGQAGHMNNEIYIEKNIFPLTRIVTLS